MKGYPTESATFDRKTDAKQWARLVESEMRAGRYLTVNEAKRHTLGEMVDRYIRDVLPSKSYGTRRVQGPQLEWWKAQLGDRLLSEVTPSLIVESKDELLHSSTRHGTKRSPSTVLRYMAALSHCYSIAMKDWQWVDDTPMRRISKPKESKGRTRFLSENERNRLLASCRESRSPYLYPIVVLAISTGMRRGEIMNLTWDRVDLGRKMITLLPENTKTGSSRAVPLAGHAFEGLEALAKERRVGTRLVFPAPNSFGADARPVEIKTAWDHALRRAEIEDFRFHDLRHTAAAYLAMNGATLAELAEVLGHQTLQMVKRYAHLTEQHTSKIVERMNRSVFGS